MPPSPPESANPADISKRNEPPKQHGVKGAYVGGKWVEIEECADKFNIKDGSCGKYFAMNYDYIDYVLFYYLDINLMTHTYLSYIFFYNILYTIIYYYR